MDLLSLRMKKGMTQEAACRELGVSLKTYIRWEKGESEPRLSGLQRLRSVFGSDIDALLKKEGA